MRDRRHPRPDGVDRRRPAGRSGVDHGLDVGASWARRQRRLGRCRCRSGIRPPATCRASISERAERSQWSRRVAGGSWPTTERSTTISRSGIDWSVLGRIFRSSSDTEVLVAAVERWGIDRALDACEGMFAVALWDKRDRELHLMRDRFGEKPLYYGWVGKVFAFGSELKALSALPGFGAELNRRAVGALPPPQLRPRPGHHLARSPQAAARSSGDVALTERGRAPRTTLLLVRSRRSGAGSTGPADRLGFRNDRSARGRIVGRSGRQDGCRRPGRSIPLGGDRFEHHRGPDAAAHVGAGADLYGGIRRSFLRRVIRGGSGRGAPRDGPHGSPCRRCRGDRGHPSSGRHMGRALRRRLPDPDLSGQPSGASRCHRVVVGRWR